MTIRAQALEWLARQKVRGVHVVASKRYAPDESWTKDKAWWLQIPASAQKPGDSGGGHGGRTNRLFSS